MPAGRDLPLKISALHTALYGQANNTNKADLKPELLLWLVLATAGRSSNQDIHNISSGQGLRISNKEWEFDVVNKSIQFLKNSKKLNLELKHSANT